MNCKPRRDLEAQGPEGNLAAAVLAKHTKVEERPTGPPHTLHSEPGIGQRALGCSFAPSTLMGHREAPSRPLSTGP